MLFMHGFEGGLERKCTAERGRSHAEYHILCCSCRDLAAERKHERERKRKREEEEEKKRKEEERNKRKEAEKCKMAEEEASAAKKAEGAEETPADVALVAAEVKETEEEEGGGKRQKTAVGHWELTSGESCVFGWAAPPTTR